MRLVDRDPTTWVFNWIECPLCKGTGRGLGEFSDEVCPCCKGDGEIEEGELDYALSFGAAEDYWGVVEDIEEVE